MGPIDFKKMAAIPFLRSLNFAVQKCDISVVFKVGQVRALEAVYLGRDVLAVLPTGYGKSLIFHLIADLISFKMSAVDMEGEVRRDSLVIVVCPLDSLMSNHSHSLELNGISSAVLRCGTIEPAKADRDSSDEDEAEHELRLLTDRETVTKIQKGEFRFVFAHPEAIVLSKEGRALLQTDFFQSNVVACIVDEAHCIENWGQDFRPTFRKLTILGSLFPDVPLVALTATAPRRTQNTISEVLGLKTPVKIIGNVDRPNIFIGKYRRGPQRLGVGSFDRVLKPIAEQLKVELIDYPLTVIYLSLKWCGTAYNLFCEILGSSQYFPEGCAWVPQNRLFAQYHAPQTERMKSEILKQLITENSTVRVVFATVALGMGVNIPHIHQVIHLMVPHTIEEYYQEIGRAGRDGKPAVAKMYFNGSDIAANKTGMTEEMRQFCSSDSKCLRLCLLEHFGMKQKFNYPAKHHCCSVCATQCSCEECLLTEAMVTSATLNDASSDKPLTVVTEQQRKSLESALSKYRLNLLQQKSYLCTGFTKQTIDFIVQNCEQFITFSDLKEKVQFWTDELALAVFELISSHIEF